MIELLAIDPGTKNLGWAAFEANRLVEAGASLAPRSCTTAVECFNHHIISLPMSRNVVVEYMAHRQNDAKSQAKSLLAVQWMGAAVAGRKSVHNVYGLLASEWKGSIPKNIHHQRVVKALDFLESNILNVAISNVRRSNHKEVLDAVGIGLYHIQRIDRAGRLL